MMLNGDHLAVEGYEEIAVEDMNDMSELVENEEDIQYAEADEEGSYGGMPIEHYNDIVAYKRTNNVPNTMSRQMDRSAPSHWRARCKCFSMADDGETLLYYNPENTQNAVPKVVVKKGEVPKVLQRIHELIGHLGQKRTQMVVLRKLYWRSVRQDVKTFIANCDFCAHKKAQGQKISKAPVDITSDNFDISVLVRDTESTNGDRLEFHLVGYNETEVRQLAETRMTSYTFKETSAPYRSRYPSAAQSGNYRRQPYVRKNNHNQNVSYLLPFQTRPRVEPSFIEVYSREEYQPDVLYDNVVPEMDDGMLRQQRENSEKDHDMADAQPITMNGSLLQAKNFKVEEPEELAEDKTVRFLQDGRTPGPSSAVNVAMAAAQQKQMSQRYHQQKRLMEMDPEYPRERRSPQRTTTAGLVKKRRRELPSIRGMANRFSMAIGEADRIDNTEVVNRSNPHMIEYNQDPSSIMRGDITLPPVIMAPSTNDEVCKLQIEALQRHIHLQKMQEKYMHEQYEASLRIPITRYIQQEEEDVQEEQLEVEDELNVIDDHQVYHEEHEEQLHH